MKTLRGIQNPFGIFTRKGDKGVRRCGFACCLEGVRIVPGFPAPHVFDTFTKIN